MTTLCSSLPAPARAALTYCLPPITYGLGMAGIARVFTVINPMSAGVFAATAAISSLVFSSTLPDCDGHGVINSISASIGGIGLGLYASEAMGYSLSLGQVIVLSVSTNLLLIGLGAIVFFATLKFFGTPANAGSLVDNFGEIFGAMIGDEAKALAAAFLGIGMTRATNACCGPSRANEPNLA